MHGDALKRAPTTACNACNWAGNRDDIWTPRTWLIFERMLRLRFAW